MPCDTRLKPAQTISQRADEVRRSVSRLDELIRSNRVRVRVSPQGAVAFADWEEGDRDGVTDACAYRRLMVSGSSLSKAAIAKAEMVAGRTVDRRVLAHGHHSHDGGETWHHGH